MFGGLPAAGICGGLPISPMSIGRKQRLLSAAFGGREKLRGRGGVDSVGEKIDPLSNQPDRCRYYLIRVPCATSTFFGADPLGNPAAISASGLRPMVLRTALSCRLPFSSGEIPMKVNGSITNRYVKERVFQSRKGILQVLCTIMPILKVFLDWHQFGRVIFQSGSRIPESEERPGWGFPHFVSPGDKYCQWRLHVCITYYYNNLASLSGGATRPVLKVLIDLQPF